jgi:2-polyprenyl-6-hydroxyphenyl methylase/3-demethylubiquinone-9 3-methyltransferase
VLKFGGRFFCLGPHADYVWYRTIAPLLGFATKHLSSDRMLTCDEFAALLDQAGFRRIRSAAWTFIPKGDVPALVALLLTVPDLIGRHARLDSVRGGLCLCAWKEAKLLANEKRSVMKTNIVRLAARAKPSHRAQLSPDTYRA